MYFFLRPFEILFKSLGLGNKPDENNINQESSSPNSEIIPYQEYSFIISDKQDIINEREFQDLTEKVEVKEEEEKVVEVKKEKEKQKVVEKKPDKVKTYPQAIKKKRHNYRLRTRKKRNYK